MHKARTPCTTMGVCHGNIILSKTSDQFLVKFTKAYPTISNNLLSLRLLLVITQSITFQSMTQKKVMKWAKTCIIKMATREEIKIQNHESSFNAKIQHVMSECHFINFFHLLLLLLLEQFRCLLDII